MRKLFYSSVLFLSIAMFLFSCTPTEKIDPSIFADAALYVQSPPVPESPEPVETAEQAEEYKPQEITSLPEKEETALNTANAEDFYNLGLSLEKTGRYEEAAKAYQQAVKIKPDYAEAYYNLGVSLDDAGRYEDAIEAYKQAVRIDNNHIEAYYNLGVSLENMGRFDDAIEAYKQVVDIYPNHIDAHYNLSLSHLTLDDMASVMEEYRILRKIAPKKSDKLYMKAIERARQDNNNKYILQLGAFKNNNNANALLNKLKNQYMHAYIERESSINKVRLTGINSREELYLIKEEIKEKLKINPYIIKIH